MATSKMNLRQKKRISYYELEEPSFDEYIYCDECCDSVYEYCAIHGPLLIIPDDKVPLRSPYPPIVPHAALTIPSVFLHLARSNIPGAGIGVFSTLTLPRGVRFGPYRGLRAETADSEYCWQIYDRNNKPSHVVDAADAARSNWMRYVNCARGWHEQNLVAYQYRGDLYYRTVKVIRKFEELLVWYGGEFARSLRVDRLAYTAPPLYAPRIGRAEGKISFPKCEEENLPETKTVIRSDLKPSVNDSFTDNVVSSSTDNVTPSSSGVPNDVAPSDDATKNHDIAMPMVSQNSAHDQNNNTDEHKQFICNDCGKSFNLKAVLIVHIISHTRTKKIEQNGRKNDTDKKHVCELCDFRTVRRYSLQRHLKIHTGEKPHKCTYCTFRSAEKYKLIAHIRIHTCEKPYTCDYCTFKSARQHDLKRHIRTHTDEKPLICNYCTFKFASQQLLIRHIRSHTGEKPYECNYCTFKSARQHNLKRHIRSHTGEKFKCNYCTFKSASQQLLIRHIRSHTGEKPYECNYCTFKSARQHNLKTHIRTHTGEKPYKCSFCTHKSTRQCYLKLHIQKTHAGET